MFPISQIFPNAAGRQRIRSEGVMQYSPSSLQARSPAVPWSQTALRAENTGSKPCASSAQRIPQSTSPEPPFAKAGLPVGFTVISCPRQTRVPCPFRIRIASGYRAANSSAPARRPDERSPPRRRNSPSCGVRISGTRQDDSSSGLRPQIVRASASRTRGHKV